MAIDSSSQSAESGPAPLSPAARKRLQQCYDFGQAKRKQGDHAYAHSMFAQAVVGDPASLVYVEAMLDNLREYYGDKKNRNAKVRASRSPFKKAQAEKRWMDIIQLGVQLLEENPWDIPTLRGIAEACAALRYNEVELRYLKNALDANPRDIDVNRHCATSLARMGQFDQAIACWHRVEELLPGKGEASRMISELTLEKNRAAAGFTEEAPASASGLLAKSGSRAGSASPGAAAPRAAPTRESLEVAIASDPANVNHYLALADLHDKAGEAKESEQILRRALQVAGNHVGIRERLEETQLRIAQKQLAIAQRRALESGDAAARQLAEQLHQDVNRLELAIYQSRCERYPDKIALRYELAVRLKRAHLFEEAQRNFQAVTGIPSLAASATVQLGECQQHLRQYQASLESYLTAVELARADGATETLKLALYRAGVLESGMKLGDAAKGHLTELVTLDPQFKDARLRLDKLTAIQDTPGL